MFGEHKKHSKIPIWSREGLKKNMIFNNWIINRKVIKHILVAVMSPRCHSGVLARARIHSSRNENLDKVPHSTNTHNIFKGQQNIQDPGQLLDLKHLMLLANLKQ